MLALEGLEAFPPIGRDPGLVAVGDEDFTEGAPNLRVILHRIWGEQKLTYRSWAIQRDPEPLDQEFWHKRDVDILNIRLEDYVLALGECLRSVARAGSP